MMQFNLPEWIQQFLATEAGPLTHKQLRPAQAQLSQNYREQSNQAGLRLNSLGARQVYRLTRLPAIYGVLCQIGQEIQTRWPEFQPHTLLDLGAGPGTVPLALSPYFSSLQQLILLEQDREQVRWGERLFAASQNPLLQKARWQVSTLDSREPFPGADFITLSYVLNELSPQTRQALSERLLTQAAKMLLFIEPGTPDGYRNILEIRNRALQKNWSIFGPCPHTRTCPLKDTDWCHFATRTPRSQLQRSLKEAVESYEDEKFCWLALTPQPVTLTEQRILRRPNYRKGVVDLTLCTPQGTWEEKSIGKSQALYKTARKADWGGTLPANSLDKINQTRG